MILLISIFGGMLLTVLLYGAGRMLKLSNFWAAVLAAGLPTLAYLGYAVGRWPGLDVVTLHVVAYPTVAVLLFQMYVKKPGQDLHVHWVPKLLIAFFVTITVLYGGFVYIAGNGLPPALAQLLLPNAKGKILHTGFAGSIQHGEEAAKSIAHQRNIEARLARLGWNVEISGLDGLTPGRSDEIRLLLRRTDGGAVAGRQARLGFARPGEPGVSDVVMQEVSAGDYRVQSMLPGTGKWLAVVSFDADGKRLNLEREVGQP